MLLEMEGVSAAYGKAIALENVSMGVAAGELVVVLGPNGAGKSTLLKVISGSLPSQGRLQFDGKSLQGLAIVVIEHDMRFIFNLCDRVLCLVRGRTLIEGTAAQVQSDPRVIEAYIGSPETDEGADNA